MTTKLANRDPIAILSESKSAIILESRDLLFAEKRALGMTLEESHSDFITRHVIDPLFVSGRLFARHHFEYREDGGNVVTS